MTSSGTCWLASLVPLPVAIMVVFVVLGGGCMSVRSAVGIDYEQTDLPAAGAIEMRYKNRSKTKMCVSAGLWPNQAGGITEADKTAFLVAGARRFPMRLFIGDYCVGNKCRTVVKPGQTLVARIPYEFFDLPSDLTGEAKHLEFTARATPCD